jgi:formiminoglutamase
VDLARLAPLDAGNVRVIGTLEDTQATLAQVIGGILQTGAVPIVLGGGHETAYGHYLGYTTAARPVGIVNLDAHLDVRPCLDGKGHSGSPFRQALEHPNRPLSGRHYICIGVQPQNTSQAHWRYARERGCLVRWYNQVRRSPVSHLKRAIRRLGAEGCQVYVSLDADVVGATDVPGVSAPNLSGLPGRKVLACARAAGYSAAVTSFDVVEINPRYDLDGRSSRWAALAVWHFLMGLAHRPLR